MNSLAPFDRLVRALSRLPGVGRKSAERMAVKLVRDGDALIDEMVRALQGVSEQLCTCGQCGIITSVSDNPCRLCTDPHRDESLLCVVEDPGDINLLEQSGSYKGRYHALMGKLSPMRGEGIHNVRVETLLQRVKEGGVTEVVLALNSDVESDATAYFLHDLLTAQGVSVSRIAFGLPVGSGIAYADPVTLSRALQGRREMAQ